MVMLFAHFENLFGPWQLLFEIRIINLVTVQLLHLSLRNEASLEPETLFCQVLAAIIPDLLLCDAFSLLKPVSHDLPLDNFL